MMHYEKDEIKKLIKSGFDLELISFELDIPIEEVEQCKKELEVKKSSTAKIYTAQEIIERENRQAHQRMEQIKERYRKLYFANNKGEEKGNQIKELTKEEIEKIDLIIDDAKKTVENLKEISKAEKKQIVKKMITQLKNIQKERLTVEQAEKLYILLQDEELKKMKKTTPELNYFLYAIDKLDKVALRKLVDAVNIAQEQSDDVEELKELDKRLTIEMQHKNYIVVSTAKNKIRDKIVKISQSKGNKNIDIPKEIEEIIIDISKGVLDIENANRTIEYETKKRLENRPKTIFRLTEEQVKRQIFIQIKTALKDSPEQYYLENPERSILQMEQLMGGELEQNIRIVVDNLLELKDFERAKEVCNTFLNKSEENSFITYIRTLKKQINNTELGDIILKGIKTTGTAREERAYLNLIEKGLKAGNVKLESISLGKSQDGLRKISLADVWTDEKQR